MSTRVSFLFKRLKCEFPLKKTKQKENVKTRIKLFDDLIKTKSQIFAIGNRVKITLFDALFICCI